MFNDLYCVLKAYPIVELLSFFGVISTLTTTKSFETRISRSTKVEIEKNDSLQFELNEKMTSAFLKWPDYLLLTSFLAASIGIGLYHALTGGRQRTTAEFIMADRRLKVLPTAISLLVSFQSAIGLLGCAAESYSYGIQYLIFAGFVSSTAATYLVSRLFVPLFYPLKLVSVNEYLERRFMSKAVRMFAAVLGTFGGMMYAGTTLFVTSAALESATGLSLRISVPLMAFVSVVYTALGGMRAVIWTDVFQFVIMVGGIATILIKGLISVDGIANVFRVAQQEGRLQWADFSPDPRVRHTVWGLTIALTIMWTYLYGISQAAVQRYSAVQGLSKAKLTVAINLPPLLTINVVNSFMGLVVLTYYAIAKCDPIANKDVSNRNQLLPFFVFNIFSDVPGFAGVFLVTLYGASLSTISTSLSGLAAIIWEDILQWKLAKLTESRKTLINRFLIAVIGALSNAVAFLAAEIPGPITQVIIALNSSSSGPLIGMYFLGTISKHANWKGTLIGGFSGLAFCLWLSVGSLTMGRRQPYLPPVSIAGCKANATVPFSGSNSSTVVVDAYKSLWNDNVTDRTPTQPDTEELQGVENLYAISYIWFATFSAFVTTVVGLTASTILRDKALEEKVEERYLLKFRNLYDFRCRIDTHKEDNVEEGVSVNEPQKTSSNRTQLLT